MLVMENGGFASIEWIAFVDYRVLFTYEGNSNDIRVAGKGGEWKGFGSNLMLRNADEHAMGVMSFFQALLLI